VSALKRWRGLRALVKDAVEHGSLTVERVQKETAARPFTILEQIPPIAELAKGVHEIHDLSVSSVHGIIRLVNRVVATTLDGALDLAERIEAERAAQPAPVVGDPAPVVSDPAPVSPGGERQGEAEGDDGRGGAGGAGEGGDAPPAAQP
jgi:hypothetical protein